MENPIGGVFAIKESVPLLEKGDHIKVSRMKERSKKGFDPSMSNYYRAQAQDYYRAKAGSGIPGFQGTPALCGVGGGGIFCSLCQHSQK